MDKHQANIEARVARHEKMNADSQSSQKVEIKVRTKRSLLSRFVSRKPLGHMGHQSMAVSKLLKRIFSVTMAFFVISSFGPLYYFTEGQEGYDGEAFVDVTEQETDSILAEMMTEDGFLLKPALNNSAGDRSTSKEVFIYQVQPGDSLSSVAQRFNIKKDTLVMENNLWNVNSLKSGMSLRILPVDGVSHTVQKGDTLSKIAKQYKVDETNILRQNQLEKGSVLAATTTLIIPGGIKEVVVPKPTYVAKNGKNGGSVRAGGNGPRTAGPGYSGPATGRLIWPTLGAAKLTQGYTKGHPGLDIANRNRGPIYAAAAGKVIRAEVSGWNGGYGNVVEIDHGNGMITLYGHNEKVYVKVGDTVTQGQTIAWMGNTGNVRGVTGIHVHFEVWINKAKYDPRSFF